MRTIPMILLALTLGGCVGDGSVGVDEYVVPLPMPSGDVSGFKVFVQVGPHYNGEQTVAVRLEGRDQELGSYQGTLGFDPGGLSLLGTVEPSDGYRILNTEASAQGEIRFAGFTVDGFSDRELLRLHFRSREPIRESQITVNLTVVGTLGGAAVPKDRILREPGLFKLQ